MLLRGDIPEILEPYISATPAPGVTAGDTRILDFKNLDSPAAAALLAVLPAEALDLDLSIYAPPAGITLRVVAENPGTVVAGGSVISPELPGEALQVRELTIYDPALADVPPDIVPAELPAWIEELPPEDRRAYLDARDSCLEHGTTRQAWITAVVRYNIHEARRFPYTSLITDEETGTRGVWFAW